MTSSSFLSLVSAQTWQIAMLAGVVWMITRFATRDRAHVSHMLWALVLLKCVTPPIWSSPVGLFSQISTPIYSNQAFEHRKEPHATNTNQRELIAATITYGSAPFSSTQLTANSAEPKVNASTFAANLYPAIVFLWTAGVLISATISIIRFAVFLRVIGDTTIETPSEISNCVARLNSQLGLGQRVGVKVVSSAFGPSVYGLLRPIVIFPHALLVGRTEKQLEPLIAHEMIHIRRGDLLLAFVQSLACCVGWFHPMVWLASRRVTIESERCCDEETIAALQCKPAAYARGLLDVLERKHLLRVAQALPGVRPVDITSARLERIMRIGQGSRSRAPWWVWCVASLGGIAILPGAHYVKADPPEVMRSDAKDSDATDAIGELRMAPPLLKPADEAPYVLRKGEVQIEIELLGIRSSTNSTKTLDDWLGQRNKPAREIKTVRVGPPILWDLPYLNQLFVNFRENIGNVISTEDYSMGFIDGKLEQVHPTVAPKEVRFVVMSEEERSQLFESILPPLDTVTFSRPTLITITGIAANIYVGQMHRLTQESAISVGFQLSVLPVLTSNDQVRLEYEMTSTKLLEKISLDGLLSQDEAAKDLPDTFSTAKISASVELLLGQTLVMVSQRGYKDAPYEIVVIKCLGWSDNQKHGDESDSSQESPCSPVDSRESSASLPVDRVVK